MASRTRRGSSNGNGSGYLNGPSGQADGVDWAAETGFPSVSGLIDDHALDVFADAERLVVVGWGEAPTALGSGLSFSMVGPPTAP